MFAPGPCADTGDDRGAGRYIGPCHRIGPDCARIIDVNIDIVAGERVECDHGAEAFAVADLISGILQPLADQPGEDELLAETLRADGDRGAGGNQAGGDRQEDGGGEHAQRCERPAAPARRDASLDHAEQRIDAQRERGGGEAADQHQRPVLRLQSGKDHVAERGLADGGGERRRADGPDRGGADAGHQHGGDQRCLDQPQFLATRHPHAVRRLDDRGIETGEAGDAVPEDRQQRIEHQREQRREEAERRDAPAGKIGERQQQGIEQRQQRQ